jgi:3D (Asp-Asp-Asp) domain-containing protein
LIKSLNFHGSTLALLLVFSVISYSRSLIQSQDPKPVQQPTQSAQPLSSQSGPTPGGEDTSADPSNRTKNNADIGPTAGPNIPQKSSENVLQPGRKYTATAYSLPGRTSSGRPASRGLIAADPSVLPLGTRVRVDAGEFSGEYVVADTGGAVKGHRIDIWTPTLREARRFGRRTVKLTVLELGGKRSKNTSNRRRQVPPANPQSSPLQATTN